MENKENIFSDRLKKIRIDNDMSQHELAKYLGITPSSLSYYENGLRIPPITILNKLTKLFNVSVDWLLGVEEIKSTKLETYADMLKLIIPLLDYPHIWRIEFKDNNMPFDNVVFNGLETDDHHILDFLNDYQQMLELTNKASVPKDLFKTWIDNRLQIFSSIKLPHNEYE